MTIFLVIMFGGMFISIPIVFTILGSTLYFTFINDIDLIVVPQRMVIGLDSFIFLAIPFFIFVGLLMGGTGITQRLVRLSDSIVGGIQGGLAHVDIFVSMIMGGIQGSAVAEAAAIGSLLIPPMVRSGYSPGFAAAVTSTASALGPIIPPSITMVIYGSLCNVSVGRLFLAGFIPGVILAVFLMTFSYFICKRKGWGASKEKRSVVIFLTNVKDSMAALMVPIIIIGGIVGGIFTPTESGAIALFYVLLVSVLRLGGLKLDFKSLVSSIQSTINVLGAVMFIIAASSVFGWLMNRARVADNLGNLLLSITTNPIMILFLINVILLFLGCFVEVGPILIVLTPILVPFVTKLGIDPVHFGIIVVMNLMIGMNTPPVGLSMYITCGIANITMGEWLKDAWLLLIAMVSLGAPIC